jgi:tight adherence protein B
MVSAMVLALAVLCWPVGGPPRRLRAILSLRRARPRLPWPVHPTTSMVAAGSAVAGWVVCGPGGAVAAALAAVTIWRRWSARRTVRTTLAAVDGLAEALASVVAELRAGAHPARATESAAADAEPRAAQAMRAIAAAARLDGDVHQALTRIRTATPAVAQALRRLTDAWVLAQRHGLPLAEVLDAVRGDLQARVRFARQVHARLAGPRTSAAILALLPVLGVGFGEAMSAHPIHILTTTPAGQLLLVLGTTLTCAGVAWSARLTAQVVLP